MDKKDIIIAFLALLLLFAVGYAFLSQVDTEDPPVENGEEEIIEEEEEVEEEDVEDVDGQLLRDIVLNYIGAPYGSDPMDDDENIYNNEEFNSTTLVLVSAADYHFPEDPEEGMKQIHYYPPGEVSYENRLHFSTYRNQVSDYFSDITAEVGGELTESKEVVLNKEREDGRLLEIDWEEEITLEYIYVEDFLEVISELPEIAGVTFIVDGDEEIGLDVRREGLLLDGDRFVHSCSNQEEVIEENILDFLEDQDYDGVNFFKINE